MFKTVKTSQVKIRIKKTTITAQLQHNGKRRYKKTRIQKRRKWKP